MTTDKQFELRTVPGIWTGQLLHAMSLLILLPSLWFIWKQMGSPHPVIFWIAVAFAVGHQVYVWLTWRLELNYSSVSRTIGFRGYLILFFTLFIGRGIAIVWLGWIDAGSLGMDRVPQWIILGILGVVYLYTAYSIQRYFGLERAAGADHFVPAYCKKPLVKGGIFRYTNNGMYVFGFFLLWIIAIGFNSKSALAVTAFSHIYIWVHYHATEKPDMDYLYGEVSG